MRPLKWTFPHWYGREPDDTETVLITKGELTHILNLALSRAFFIGQASGASGGMGMGMKDAQEIDALRDETHAACVRGLFATKEEES